MEVHPRRHDILWFADGNVVLATDSLLFRVHRGVLSLHSTVLRDMFDLPLAASGDEELPSTSGDPGDGVIRPDVYEGLPMVFLSGDKGEDVAHLLRAVYERGYYNRDDDNAPLDMVIALLILSAKYDIASVRKDVLGQLSRNYPTTLAGYELVEENAMLFGLPRDQCHFPLLRAAAITSQSQTDIRIVLPTLYYACSTFPMDRIILKEAPELAFPMLQALLLGKSRSEQITRLALEEMLNKLSTPAGCPYAASLGRCTAIRRNEITEAMMGIYVSSTLASIKGAKVVDVFFERRCRQCRAQIAASLETARNFLWTLLPSSFGFDSWDTIQGAA